MSARAEQSPTPLPARFAGYRIPRFVVVSAVVHLAAAGALGVFGDPAWRPKLEITWLDLDNRLGAPQAPTAPQPKPPEPPQEKAATPAKKKAAKAPARPKKKKAKRAKKKTAKTRKAATAPFSTRKVALSKMAPGNAALMLLLRMDRIRRSRHADAVRRLLEVFYDFKTLLWSPKLDVVRDFDAVLIATPNPYRVTETFLALRHRMSERRLRAVLEESVRIADKRMRWRRGPAGLRGTIPSPPKLAHDRRRVIVRPGLALLTTPEHEGLLLARQPSPDPKDRQAEQPTLLDALQQMELEGGGDDRQRRRRQRGKRPGLLLQVINLPRLVRLPRDIPAPSNLQVTIPALESALVEAVLSFADDREAKRFLVAIKPRLRRARASILLRLMGLGRMLDRLRLTRAGSQVEARVRLSGDEVRDLLDLFRSAIPQVYVPGMPPRTAPPRTTPPDAGLAAKPGTDAGGAVDTDAGTGDGGRITDSVRPPADAGSAPAADVRATPPAARRSVARP